MSKLIPNIFSTYELTPQEEDAGQVLTYEQRCVLQNKLAEVAQSKLVITFDTLNPAAFAQDEAYLRGQLDVINWLLDTSATVLAERAQRIAESQQ